MVGLAAVVVQRIGGERRNVDAVHGYDPNTNIDRHHYSAAADIDAVQYPDSYSAAEFDVFGRPTAYGDRTACDTYANSYNDQYAAAPRQLADSPPA